MPLYDFQCEKCGTVKEIRIPLDQFRDNGWLECEKCKDTVWHNLLVRPPAIDDWGQGKFFEHLGPKGKTFYDKKSYKEHLKQNGLVEWSPKTGMPGSGV